MARKKSKIVALAIEPNKGVQIKYSQLIQQIVENNIRSFRIDLIKLINAKYSPRKAQDAAPPKDDDLLTAISKLSASYANKISGPASKTSKWFVRSILKSLTPAQKRALKKAGVSMGALHKKWTVPIAKDQFIAPSAAKKIPAYVEWSTNLITNLSEEAILRIQDKIAEGLSSGINIRDLTNTIYQVDFALPARADLVARDQACKINQFVQRENCKALGITEGIWVHVPGQYTSRTSHIALNGKRFNLSEGMFDKKVQKYVMPGELPYCKCIFQAVIPEDIQAND